MLLRELTVLAAAAVIGATPIAAKGLDKAHCAELKSEQATLITAGVKTDMQNGPNWAKAHLDSEHLLRIKRYLTVEEQLLFRCPRPRLILAKAKLPKAAAPSQRAGNVAKKAAKVKGWLRNRSPFIDVE